MRDHVAVRVAAEPDVPDLFAIRTSVHQNHLTLEQLADKGITPASVVDMLRSGSRAWVADVAGVPAAFAMANAAERTVFAMFVRPEFEGRGLGRALMAEAERWLFDGGAHDIWLLTGGEPDIRAHGFYRRLGWAPDGAMPDGQIRYVKHTPAETLRESQSR